MEKKIRDYFLKNLADDLPENESGTILQVASSPKLFTKEKSDLITKSRKSITHQDPSKPEKLSLDNNFRYAADSLKVPDEREPMAFNNRQN